MRTNQCIVQKTKKGNNITWRIKAGKNGTGRTLHTISGWDNPVSIDATWRIIYDYVRRNNLDLIDNR